MAPGNGKMTGGLGMTPVRIVPGAMTWRRPPKKYADKGWDFPRQNVEVKPSEVLYDPSRILGSYVWAKIKSTGRTVYVPPRIESTLLIQREEVRDCPPPSQLPYIKRQIHLDPSRDAEIFDVSGRADVPGAVGTTPGVATVFRFTTFNNLRTFIKWTHIEVSDALWPPLMTVQFLIDGVPIKVWAWNTDVTTSGDGYTTTTTGAVSTNTNAFPCLPEFQNSLWEITDQHTVECVARNLAPADRRVGVCIWGWIESITAWDEKVKR